MSVVSDQRDFEFFVGIDLGGGKGKNTAVAVIVRNGETAHVRFVGTRSPAGVPFYDEVLVDFVGQQGEQTVVAVDAPLTLTVCARCRLPSCPGLRRCTDLTVDWFRRHVQRTRSARGSAARGKPDVTPYTQRATEVLLSQRYGVMPRETLGQGMGPLTARAHYLRRALESRFTLNENLLEVYPKATLGMLFGVDEARRYKRQVNTWRTRAEMLEALAEKLRFDVWREGALSNDHCFDAVICAYTAFLWATEGWSFPTDDREVFAEDGWIWVPPPAHPEPAHPEPEESES